MVIAGGGGAGGGGGKMLGRTDEKACAWAIGADGTAETQMIETAMRNAAVFI